MMKHINVIVSGLVQGVYFRASTKEAADRLGICGFVTNRSDGNVYLEAQGEDKAMKQFCEWLKQGPPAARVDKLKISEGTMAKITGFVIRPC